MEITIDVFLFSNSFFYSIIKSSREKGHQCELSVFFKLMRFICQNDSKSNSKLIIFKELSRRKNVYLIIDEISSSLIS